jgi:hypothetical protein
VRKAVSAKFRKLLSSLDGKRISVDTRPARDTSGVPYPIPRRKNLAEPIRAEVWVALEPKAHHSKPRLRSAQAFITV